MPRQLDNLVFDRTQSDVERVKQLTAALVAGTATAAERAEFVSGLKGAYNATDLNRVGAAVEYLRDRLSDDAGTYVDVAPKTDWTETDIPNQPQATQYIADIQNIRAAFILPDGTPEAPDTLTGLTYSQANAIETILYNLDKTIDTLKITLITSGEVFAGEV